MHNGLIDRVIYAGERLRIEWAVDSRGRCPAREVFETLTDKYQAVFMERFKRLADYGVILNRVQFKKLDEGVFEFKKYQTRFFGDFRPGRFLVAHGVTDKKSDKLSPADMEKTRRILRENDEMETPPKGARK